nr:MAG TPA: hypothetical protein [Caudoviricetes sp.]
MLKRWAAGWLRSARRSAERGAGIGIRRYSQEVHHRRAGDGGGRR